MSYEKETLPKPHTFVAALTKKGSVPPKLRILQGYIGETNSPDHIWLYLDMELLRFLDILVLGIAYFKDFRDAKNPLAGVILWVRHLRQK